MAKAIKVTIGLRANGHADHPDWTTLPFAAGGRNPEEKETLVRAQSNGSWFYDNVGHAEEDIVAGSPVGVQLGYRIVSDTFATEAVAAFPLLVSTVTEAQFETFYDTRHAAEQTVNNDDAQTLTALQVQLELSQALTPPIDTTVLEADIRKALDPNDRRPGVIKNPRKTWTDYKAKFGNPGITP